MRIIETLILWITLWLTFILFYLLFFRAFIDKVLRHNPNSFYLIACYVNDFDRVARDTQANIALRYLFQILDNQAIKGFRAICGQLP